MTTAGGETACATDDVKNLRPGAKDAPTNASSEPGKAAREAIQVAECKAQDAIAWYMREKSKKKHFGRGIRNLAVVCTAVAGLFPVLLEIFPPSNPPGLWRPAWVTIAVLVGAGLIWFDRFHGFTSGWMRYLLTSQRINELLDEFRFDVRRQMIEWNGADPTVEQSRATIVRAYDLVAAVNQAVGAETQQWVEEFRQSLAGLDAMLKASKADPPSGGQDHKTSKKDGT